jgi:hypothetical protein
MPSGGAPIPWRRREPGLKNEQSPGAELLRGRIASMLVSHSSSMMGVLSVFASIRRADSRGYPSVRPQSAVRADHRPVTFRVYVTFPSNFLPVFSAQMRSTSGIEAGYQRPHCRSQAVACLTQRSIHTLAAFLPSGPSQRRRWNLLRRQPAAKRDGCVWL